MKLFVKKDQNITIHIYNQLKGNQSNHSKRKKAYKITVMFLITNFYEKLADA